MFTRPDAGSAPVSYPVPTYSAAKGMFEAVVRLKSAYIKPTRVEILKPIRFESYVTNYGGPLRKPNQRNYQLAATILVDVHYRIYGEIHGKFSVRDNGKTKKTRPRSGKKDHCKLLKDNFDEKLENGCTFYAPCLGWKEFLPTYFGPIREKDKLPCSEITVIIPSILHSMWENQRLQPTFKQDWEIVRGVMSYETRRPANAE